jgi:GxxExxY protein
MLTDNSKLIEGAVSQAVLDGFFAVYSELGFGFLEQVYENALALELRGKGLNVRQQASVEVHYKGQVVGDYRADLLVPGKMVIEIKSVPQLVSAHEAQLLNYLRATGVRVGLLLNFGPKPQFRRRVN